MSKKKRKVFVVQKQMRWEPRKGELIPKFDIKPAEKHGELVYLLSPTAAPFNSESIITELRQKLADYTAQDALLLIGNPCIIGWVVAIAAQQTGGRVNLLQWSGKDQDYLEISCCLFP